MEQFNYRLLLKIESATKELSHKYANEVNLHQTMALIKKHVFWTLHQKFKTNI